MEFLKDFLTEETYTKVTEELNGKEIKLADLSKGDYVSREKYGALETQLVNTQALLTQKSEEYDTLMAKAGDNQALKTELETLKADSAQKMAELKTQYEGELKRAAVCNSIISDYAPRDVKDILPYVDLEKITIDGDSVAGLKEQIDPLKETKAYLFAEERKPGATGLEHGDSAENYNVLRNAFGLKENKKEN